jgi:hypothetical protein
MPSVAPALQMLERPLRWKPENRTQYQALNSTAEILLFGGAAGGLKTETLLMDAVSECFNPNLNAIIFRESFPQLADIIRKSHRLYQGYPYFGKYNPQDHVWRFPVNLWAAQLGIEKPIYREDGARIKFGYLRNDNDVHQHQGQEYSFVGFDESTHFSEFQVRYMLTRLRSTDPTLRLRLRLCTNPGNIGHEWHMHVFMGGKCPHCEFNESAARQPFKLYSDAQFSDGTPVEHTTQFIPSKVTEHTLFGDGNRDYIRKLRLQRPTEAKALLEGCWALFEGQYFSCWNTRRGYAIDVETGEEYVPEPDMRMVVPRGEVNVQWWWSGFVGGDYGYGVSAASGVLCVRTPGQEHFPNGRVYVIGEHIGEREAIGDWTRSLLSRLLLTKYAGSLEHSDGQRLKILGMYLGPDSFNDEGYDEGHSLASQSDGVLKRYGLRWQLADNDRVGGWQLIWSMLKSGELVICDNCTELLKAIPSRIHNKKKTGDIEKKPGDKLDDLMDALRYAVYTFIRAAIKPAEIRVAEVMQRAPDPTSAMIAKRKLEGQIKQEKTPVFVGSGAARRRAMFQRQQPKK